MFKKILIFIITIIIVAIFFVISWLSAMSVASVIGNFQNNHLVDVNPSNPAITYIGDSLTNGFYSSGGLQTGNFGYRSIVDEKLGATSNNFAVGGYTSIDVLEQLNTNTTLGQTNQVIHRFKTASDVDYPLDNETTISDSIANSDYVIATIGANDIIMNILEFKEDGSFSINFDTLYNELNSIRERKLSIYKKIHDINPDVQIIDVGIYFAYPHISDNFMRILYPVLMYAEHKIFINDNTLNVSKVTIRDNMQANIKEYVDNPKDVHPTQQGYQVMANEILRKIAKLQ